MAPLLAQVLPLAVGAAVSPAMLTLQVLNVARPRSPMAWAWSVVLGAGLVLALATAAAFTLHLGAGGDKAPPELRGAVKLAIGLILLAAAGRQLTRKGDRTPPRLLDEHEGARGWLRPPAVVVGGGLLAPNLALYFPALHELAASTEPTGARAAVALFAFTMAILPAAGPPLAVLALGERARPPLEDLNRAVTEHRREFTITLCVVFGLGLVTVGLVQLL